MRNGIETNHHATGRHMNHAVELAVRIDSHHPRLTQVLLFDQTDGINELVQTREWQIHDKDLDHLQQIFANPILPIGNPPDGASWTGFCSIPERSGDGYALLFNQKNGDASVTSQ